MVQNTLVEYFFFIANLGSGMHNMKYGKIPGVAPVLFVNKNACEKKQKQGLSQVITDLRREQSYISSASTDASWMEYS